jgi:hypothetical protein
VELDELDDDLFGTAGDDIDNGGEDDNMDKSYSP